VVNEPQDVIIDPGETMLTPHPSIPILHDHDADGRVRDIQPISVLKIEWPVVERDSSEIPDVLRWSPMLRREDGVEHDLPSHFPEYVAGDGWDADAYQTQLRPFADAYLRYLNSKRFRIEHPTRQYVPDIHGEVVEALVTLLSHPPLSGWLGVPS
jgi:hypothetical protein